MELPITKSQGDDKPWTRECDEVVNQRQVKARRSTRIKARCKSANAGEFGRHLLRVANDQPASPPNPISSQVFLLFLKPLADQSVKVHQSSFDKMAEFCRDHLDSRRHEPLTIVDLGSHDINGSYHSIFAQPAWRYRGVDLEPGKNVDLVLKDPYHWQELATGSVDVLVSGQTFEHTEFFWQTALEIGRVLKPGGLCCLIVPASGPEHRFPRDCWRIYPDGLSAIARYADLEILECRAQWEALPQYDEESNKWHESVLIARKPQESLGKRLRRPFRSWLNRRFVLGRLPAETIVQVFHTHDGTHRENDSVLGRVREGASQEVIMRLPAGAGLSPLRIDFITSASIIDIQRLRILAGKTELYRAADVAGLADVSVRGDAERLANPHFFRIRITGIDPQLHLPTLNLPENGDTVEVEMRLTVGHLSHR